MIRAACLLLPFLALGCAPAPMSVQQAEVACVSELGRDKNNGVSGNIGVGIGSGGPVARGGVTVTNRVLRRQSDEDFLAACIERKVAGRFPPPTVGVSVGGRL